MADIEQWRVARFVRPTKPTGLIFSSVRNKIDWN
jgi:hypothetical protein